MTVMSRNMALDFLRKHHREELSAMLQDLGRDPDEEHYPGHKEVPVPENPTEDEVIAEMSIAAALDTLGCAERQVVSMKVLGEMTFKEIAEIIDAPLGTVTWRYQNAIKKLRRCGYV
jgi:RNA polymerase sigma-70 factor (ECF subfamily)